MLIFLEAMLKQVIFLNIMHMKLKHKNLESCFSRTCFFYSVTLQ